MLLPMGSGTLPLTPEKNNFLVTISQYAQAMGVIGQINVPVDVVFVLDTSGSMNDGRAQSMVTAANSAIRTLLSASENNRVAVVAFSSEDYGGGTSNNASANVLSSLAHYDGEGETAHLSWVNASGSASGSNRSYIAGRDTVTVSSDRETRTVRAYRHGYYGGTNIHAGIVAGAKLLTAANPVYTDPDTKESVTRIPFLIVLSDGQPTYTYNDKNWYDPAEGSDTQGDGNNPFEGNGYLIALTAAYYKGLITEHYYGNNASEEQRCYIYSMGVEIDSLTDDDKNLAYITLDPATYTTGSYADANAASYWNYGNTANNNNKNTDEGWKTYWEHHTDPLTGGYYIRVDDSGSTRVWTGNGPSQAYFELDEPEYPAVLQEPAVPVAPTAPTHPGAAPVRSDYFSNSAYRAALRQYNEKLADYEDDLEQYERDLARYNQDVETYPDRVAAYEEALQNKDAILDQYEQDLETYQAWEQWAAANFSNKSGTYYLVTAESIAATNKYVNGIGYTGGIAYNDDYYDVADLNQMEATFEELVRTIQKKAMSAPTHVDANLGSNFSGYVHFSDVIGEYMELKDMKGLVADGRFYQGQSFAQLLSGYGTGSATGTEEEKKQYAFDQLIKQVLQTRMTMSASTAITAEQLIQKALASTHQAYWNSNDDYDNSIAWYGSNVISGTSNQLQMLGFADDDSVSYIEAQKKITGAIPAEAKYVCRSYFFYGDAGMANPEDYLYFMVRVQRSLEAPYQQTVVISAPASLLSVEEVIITEETDGGFTAEVSAAQPARVVYEVGLRSDINAQNVDQIVAQGYRNEKPNGAGTINYDVATGTYNFFTNDWNRAEAQNSHHRPMTEASFNAASDNAFYAYQQDTLLLDANGDPAAYNSTSGGIYYYSRTYYDWSGAVLADGVYTGVEKKTALIKVQIDAGTQLKQVGTNWYIPAGAFTASTLQTTGDDITKEPHKTGTSEVVSHAHRTGTASDSHYTVKLGNNGLLTLVSDPAKTVQNVTQQITDANGKTVMVDDVLEYKIKVVNNEGTAAAAVVTDQIPAGTELVAGSISHNGTVANGTITWNLQLDADETVTVSFRVKVLSAALSGAADVQNINNTATIKIGNAPAYYTNTTTNPPEGKRVVAEDGSVLGDVQVGDVLTYRIRFYNDSGAVAQKITVKDIVPAGTTFVSADHSGSYDAATNTVTWEFTNVAAGGSGVVSFDVRVDASAKANTTGTQPESGNIAIQNSATIQIGTNNPHVTNKTSTPIRTGDVAVKKVVATAGKENQAFTVTLTDSTGKLNGTYVLSGGSVNTVSFTNGVSEALTIRHNQTLTVKGLPEGTTLYVEETNLPSGWSAVYTDDDGGVDPRRVVVENGKLKTFTVTNSYHIRPVTFQLKGTKNFAGTNFPAGTFTFKGVRTDANGVVLTGTEADTVTATATAVAGQTQAVQFAFNPREFTKAETRYYVIDESAVGIPGVTGNGKQYMLELKVEDVNAQLTVTARIREKTNTGWVDNWSSFNWEDNSVQFTNTYAPKEVLISFSGTKNLANRYLLENEFSFQLLRDQQVIATTQNAAFGSASSSFAFKDVTITAADMGGAPSKDFTFVVREVASGLANMQDDKSLYQIVVTIEDVGGVLKETGRTITKYTPNGNAYDSATASAVVFNNVYNIQDTHITLSGNKVLTGTAATELKSEVFSFAVFESNAAFNTLGHEVTGAGNAAGTAITGGFRGAIAFADIGYKASMLENAPQVGNSKTQKFYYVAKELIPRADQPTYDANMLYDETLYKITVEVTLDVTSGVMSAKILTVQKNDEAAVNVNAVSYNGLDFTNRKNPDTITYHPVGNKDITGASAQVGLRFSFRVIGLGSDLNALTLGKVEATGISAGAALTNDAIGFTGLTYSAADVGKTYYYLIEEVSAAGNMVTYSKAQYILAVKVSRNSDTNELEIVPTYYKVNDGAAATGGLSAWTQLAITDNVEFINDFSAYATLDITGEKELTGNRPLGDKEFDFRLQLLEKNGNDSFVLPQVPSMVDGINAYNGSITFGTLIFTDKQLENAFQYSIESGAGNTEIVTYRYYVLINEIEPENAKIPGVSYSDEAYIGVIEWKITKPVNEADPAHYSFGKPTVVGYYSAVETNNVYTLGQTKPALKFTNSYAPTSTTVTITANKTLSGRELKENEFAFELYRDGTLVDIGTNDANGLITFTRTFPSNISDSYFTQTDADGNKLATFIYTLKEVKTNKGGINYSQAEYTIEVVLKHDTKTAALSVVAVTYKDRHGNVLTTGDATGKPVDADKIVFANRYTTNEVFFTPEANKTVLGANNVAKPDMLEHTFSFQVYELDANGDIVQLISADGTKYNKVVSTGTNDNTGKITFSPIFYSLSAQGAHIYKIKEMPHSMATITEDPKEFFLWVLVSDDGGGKLSIKASAYFDSFAEAKNANETVSGIGSVEFVNHYGPGYVNIDLMLDKEMSLTGALDYELKDSQFDFTIKDSVGDEVSTGTNNAAGKITFGSITITRDQLGGANTKDFVYTITENATASKGVTKDTKTITVTVTVTDDGYGNLTYDVVYTDDDATAGNEDTFTNHYTAQAVDHKIVAHKHLTGKAMAAGEFTFQLLDSTGSQVIASSANDAEGNVLFDMRYTQEGTYTYLLKEVPAANHNLSGTYTFDDDYYRITVIVSDDTEGKLFVSSYICEKIVVENGQSAAPETVVAMEFYNTFKAANLSIDLTTEIGGTKDLVDAEGNSRDDLLKQVTFAFEVRDIQNTLISTGESVWDATAGLARIQLENFTFTTDGEYHYWIYEKNTQAPYIKDASIYEIHILVHRNTSAQPLELKDENGQLIRVVEPGALYIIPNKVMTFAYNAPASASESTFAQTAREDAVEFTNTFAPKPVSITLTADKALTGRELKEGEFVFHLTETIAGVTHVRSEAVNAADGSITFQLGYAVEGVHTYSIHEHVPAAELRPGGIGYDAVERVAVITVTVVEENGNLVAKVNGVSGIAFETGATFANTYTTGTVVAEIEADKLLTGKELVADAYTFQLVDPNGNVVATAKNDAEGNICFRVTYNQQMLNLDQSGNRIETIFNYTIREVDGKALGIVYDTSAYKVQVTVSDDYKGNLTAVVTYTTGVPLFQNRYETTVAQVTIEAGKLLIGKKLQTDNFTFVLLDAQGQTVGTATNDADGKIHFRLTLEKEGIYTYTLAEKNGGERTIVYDAAKYAVRVKVTDNGLGALEATVTYMTDDGKAPLFVNTYKEPFNPSTGDNSQIPLMFAIMIGSAFALVMLLCLRPRKGGKYLK